MSGTSPTVAGVVISCQERTSAKGNRFAFVQLSDPSGVFEVVVFSELLATSRDLLEGGQRVLISVDVRSGGDGTRLSATNVRSLDEALSDAATKMHIFIQDEQAIPGIKNAIGVGETGKCDVSLFVDVGASQVVEIQIAKKIAFTGDLRAEVEKLRGVTAVLNA